MPTADYTPRVNAAARAALRAFGRDHMSKNPWDGLEESALRADLREAWVDLLATFEPAPDAEESDD